MHSFEVNIRIFQPENRDDHLGEKNAPIVLLYDTVSLFLVIKEVFFHIYTLTQVRRTYCTYTKLFQQLLFKFLKLLSDVQKNCILLKLLFS